MMTEDDAKTKWCPQVRVMSDGGLQADINCIASDCMMWRFDERRDENMVLVPCDTGGHCGLAK